MNRELDSHKVNGLNEALTIEVIDLPGHGGACHRYQITGGDVSRKSSAGFAHCAIKFQEGPISEADVNGISNEALLAVVEDRLVSFESGDYACQENALALTKVREAMMWLHKRTRDRMARGVEGTHQV